MKQLTLHQIPKRVKSGRGANVPHDVGVSLHLAPGHRFSHPGKFHLYGKSRHWTGFTSCMRHVFSSVSMMQAPFGASINERPRRLRCKWQYSLIKSTSFIPKNWAMAVMSASVRQTSPSQRQQAPQRWHSCSISGVPEFMPLFSFGLPTVCVWPQ